MSSVQSSARLSNPECAAAQAIGGGGIERSATLRDCDQFGAVAARQQFRFFVRLQQHERLQDEFDVEQRARALFQIEQFDVERSRSPRQRSRMAAICTRTSSASRGLREHGVARGAETAHQFCIAADRPRAHQRLRLPDPGAIALVFLERVDADDEQTLSRHPDASARRRHRVFRRASAWSANARRAARCARNSAILRADVRHRFRPARIVRRRRTRDRDRTRNPVPRRRDCRSRSRRCRRRAGGRGGSPHRVRRAPSTRSMTTSAASLSARAVATASRPAR